MELSESLEKKRIRWRSKSGSSWSFRHLLATGCGLGYLPLAPGTWAAAATTLGAWFLYMLPYPFARTIHILAVILLLPLTWLASSHSARLLKDPDPSIVVIDEISGQLFCLLFAPITPVFLLIALGLFRFFDIVKPPPVRQFERFPAGLGILMDDLMAGTYAAIVLSLIALYAR